MIQEILGCLWIKRDFITLTNSQLLEKIKIEENLEFYCKGICQILEEDDFFYTNDNFINKIRTIVHELRFYDHYDKEIVANFNQMLEAVHRYEKMPQVEKNEIRHNWIKKEKQARKFPFQKFLSYSTGDVYELIKKDYDYFVLLATGNGSEFSILCILNMINWICSNYPDLLKTNLYLLQSSIYWCNVIKTDKIPIKYRTQVFTMLKETEKNIEQATTKDSTNNVKVYNIIKPEQKD